MARRRDQCQLIDESCRETTLLGSDAVASDDPTVQLVRADAFLDQPRVPDFEAETDARILTPHGVDHRVAPRGWARTTAV